MQSSEKIVRTKEIIGVTVKNNANEYLGKLEEIVLDKLTGQTLYVVLASDTIFGMGGKYFALPWKAISYDASDSCYVIDVDKETLKNEPGFNKDYWPDKADLTLYRYTEKTY